MEVRQNIVVFTGAGISKESGIPTFRDMDGMWKKYDAMKLASAAGFEEDPEAATCWRCSPTMPTWCWQNWRNSTT